MMAKVRATILYTLLGMLAGLGVVAMVVPAPASQIIAAENYPHGATPGSMVQFDFVAEKNRECVTQTTRWLWRDIDGRREIIELSYAAMAFGHDTPGQPRTYRFMFEIPTSLPAGQWNVRTQHADYCWPWSWVLGPRLRTAQPIGLLVAARRE